MAKLIVALWIVGCGESQPAASVDVGLVDVDVAVGVDVGTEVSDSLVQVDVDVVSDAPLVDSSSDTGASDAPVDASPDVVSDLIDGAASDAQGGCAPASDLPLKGPLIGWPLPVPPCGAVAPQGPSATWETVQGPPSATASVSGCVLWRDVDGDGDDDLVWTSKVTFDDESPQLSLARRVGDSWSKVESWPLPAGASVYDCAGGDLDRDGKVDVVVATSKGVRVLRGGKEPAWSPKAWLPAIARALPVGAVAIADFDRDGWLDLYLARHGLRRDECSMFSCDAAGCAPQAGLVGARDLTLVNKLSSQGGFSERPLGHWGVSGSVSVQDVNRDGWPDLWLASAEGTSRVAVNTGAQGWWYAPSSAVERPRSSLWVDEGWQGQLTPWSGGLGPTQASKGAKPLDVARAEGALVPVDTNNDGLQDLVRIPLWRQAQGSASMTCQVAREREPGALQLGPLSAASVLTSLPGVKGGAWQGHIPAAAVGQWQGAPALAWVGGDGTLRLGRWKPASGYVALSLKLEAQESAPNAEGALVQVELAGRSLERRVGSHPGRGVSTSALVRLGLGTAPTVTKVSVWWPSGRRSVLSNVDTNAVLVVKESEASLPNGSCGGSADAGAGVSDAATGDAGQGSPLTPSDKPWAGPPKEPAAPPSALPLAAFTLVSPAELPTDSVGYARCTAVADWDGDGDDDVALIFLSKQSAEVRVWRGPGKSVVKTSLDTSLFFPAGDCAVTDVDDDGVPDLVLAGSPGLLLLRGQGDGSFVDQTSQRLPAVMMWNAYSVTPADMDGDGDIDLHAGVSAGGIGCGNLSCQVEPGDFFCFLNEVKPSSPSELDRALRLDPGGTYSEQTQAWKMPPGSLSPIAAVMPGPQGGGSLWVTDDFGQHHVLSLKAGVLRRSAGALGLLPYAHGMGWGAGDFNRDGLWDMVLADLGPSILYIQRAVANGQQAVYSDDALAWGLATWSRDVSGWSPLVADFDHDGRDDVLLGTAAICPPGELTAMLACEKLSVIPPQHDLLFINKGETFEASRTPAEPDPVLSPDAVAQALIDMDDDGDLDVVQVRASGRLRWLRNDLAKVGASVTVRLKGPPGNKLAVGAILRGKLGPYPVLRYVGTVAYGGAGLNRVHVGIGTAKSLSDVEVTWPDGKVTKVGELQAGKHMTVVYP